MFFRKKQEELSDDQILDIYFECLINLASSVVEDQQNDEFKAILKLDNDMKIVNIPTLTLNGSPIIPDPEIIARLNDTLYPISQIDISRRPAELHMEYINGGGDVTPKYRD